MKKIILSAFVLVFFVLTAAAQRYAIIDTSTSWIRCRNIKRPRNKLDQFSEQWQQEIDARQAELDKMYQQF